MCKYLPLAALLISLAPGSAASSNPAPGCLTISNVLVDGQPQTLRLKATPATKGTSEGLAGERTEIEPLRLVSNAQRLEFRFGPTPRCALPPVRLAYQLEGYEKSWQEAGGEMRFSIKFFDASSNVVSAQDFVARGESVGWAGSVARSRFERRREEVRVPERAARLQLELFSGGAEQTTGIMAIDEVTVGSATTNAPRTLLFSSHSAEGSHLVQGSGVPPGWMRDGSRPSTAQLLPADEDRPLRVLAVVDTDPSTWGAWRTDSELRVPARPGGLLVLQWIEMFSVGWGGAASASYSYLPPGRYQFRVRSTTESGEWTGALTSVPLTLVPPFWQTSGFRFGLVAIAIGGVAAVVRYATWRKMHLQLQRSEEQRTLERERSRIARDIHDDLGSNLTQIALLSELAQADMEQPDQARVHLKQIFATARVVTRQLDEIVWAITPANDTIEQFTLYVSKFAQDYLNLSGIRCRLDLPDSLPKDAISSAERHNLFLATKEALHNVVKHSQADQVWLRLKLEPEGLVLLIEDNGKGLDERASAPGVGDGLANMQNRLRQIGGRFEQTSKSGEGTTVRLVLPLGQQ